MAQVLGAPGDPGKPRILVKIMGEETHIIIPHQHPGQLVVPEMFELEEDISTVSGASPKPQLPPAIEKYVTNSKRPYARKLLQLIWTPMTYPQIAEELGLGAPATVRYAVKAFAKAAGVNIERAKAGEWRDAAKEKSREFGLHVNQPGDGP